MAVDWRTLAYGFWIEPVGLTTILVGNGIPAAGVPVTITALLLPEVPFWAVTGVGGRG